MTTAFGGKPPDIPGGTPCKRTVAELIKIYSYLQEYRTYIGLAEKVRVRA